MTKHKTRAQAISAVKRSGYTLEIQRNGACIDAPKGMTFDGESHYSDYLYDPENGMFWGYIWDCICDDASMSMVPCKIEGCLTCNN